MEHFFSEWLYTNPKYSFTFLAVARDRTFNSIDPLISLFDTTDQVTDWYMPGSDDAKATMQTLNIHALGVYQILESDLEFYNADEDVMRFLDQVKQEYERVTKDDGTLNSVNQTVSKPVDAPLQLGALIWALKKVRFELFVNASSLEFPHREFYTDPRFINRDRDPLEWTDSDDDVHLIQELDDPERFVDDWLNSKLTSSKFKFKKQNNVFTPIREILNE